MKTNEINISKLWDCAVEITVSLDDYLNLNMLGTLHGSPDRKKLRSWAEENIINYAWLEREYHSPTRR